MKRYWPALLLVALALAEMGRLLFGHTIFAYRHDWNIPLFHDALIAMWHETDGFTIWNREQLGTPPFYPTLAPYLMLISALATLNLDAGSIERLILLGTLLLAGFGMRMLLRQLSFTAMPQLAGAMFFMVTPYLFNQICTGVLADSLSYAMLPWAAALFTRSLKTWKQSGSKLPSDGLIWAAAAGAVCAISSFHPVYLVLNLIIFAILAIAFDSYGSLFVALLAIVLSDAYLLLPLIPTAALQSNEILANAQRRVVYDLSPSFWEAIRLTGFKGYFAEAALGARTLRIWPAAGFLVAAGAAWALLRSRTRFGLTIGGAMLVLAVVASGTTLLGEAYYFVVSHLPVGPAFRESYRFTAVTAVLEAIGVAALFAWASALHNNRLRLALQISAFGAIAAVAGPFLLHGLASQIPTIVPPPIAQTAYVRLLREPGSSRMLYLPLLLPVSGGQREFLGIDPMIAWPPRASFGNYLPWPSLTAVASDLYHGDSDNLGAMLHALNVQYVDRRFWLSERFGETAGSDGVGWDINKFTDDSAEKNLRPFFKSALLRSPKEKIWSLNYASHDRAIGLDRLSFVSGSFAHAGLLESRRIVPSYLAQLADDALVPRMIARFPSVSLTVFDGAYFEVYRALTPPQYLIQPGLLAPEINANLGWASLNGSWSSWWWYRDRYAQSLENIALSGPASRKTLRVPVRALPGGPVSIWIKAFGGPENGTLRVRAGALDSMVRMHAGVARSDASWFFVGTAPAPFSQLQITSVSGENAIAEIATLPKDVEAAVRQRAVALMSQAAVRNVLTLPGVTSDIGLFSEGDYTIGVTLRRPSHWNVRQEVRWDRHLYAIDIPAGRTFGELPVRLTQGTHRAAFVPADKAVSAVWIEPALPALSTSGSLLVPAGSYGYAGRADGFSLVELDTNFSGGWQLDGAVEHFPIEGFANGWAIAAAQPLAITYRPLILAYAGRLLSAITLLLVLAGVALLCLAPTRLDALGTLFARFWRRLLSAARDV